MRRSEAQDTGLLKGTTGSTGVRAWFVAGALVTGLVILIVTARLIQRPSPAKRPALLRSEHTEALERPPPPTDERRAFRESILRLEQLRARVRPYPDVVEAQAALAQEALRAGDLLTVRAACRAALRLNPQATGPIYDAWGHAALRLGLIEEALTTYRLFARYAPQEVMAHLGLHRVLNETGRKAAAGEVLKRASRALRPDDVQSRLLLVQELERGGLLLYALNETERLHKALPDNQPATLAFATILMRMHRLEQAQPLLETLVAAHPDYPAAHSALAELYDSPLHPKRDRARAEHHYLEAIRLDVTAADYHESLGQICFDQARFREAAYLYTRALKIERDSASARQHLAAAYVRLGDSRAGEFQGDIARRLAARNRAEERMKVLLEQRPTNAKVRLTVARQYAANALLRKALPELQAAYVLGADASQVRREMESLYARVGMTAPQLPRTVRP